MLPESFFVSATIGKTEFKKYSSISRGTYSAISFAQSNRFRLVMQGELFDSTSIIEGETNASRFLNIIERAGLDKACEIAGDYAYCLFDRKNNCLFLGRDLFGGFPLFWRCTRQRVLVSTSHRPIAIESQGFRVNASYFASHLMLPNAGVNEPLCEETPFEGHHRVKAGERIRIAIGDNVATRRVDNYWSKEFGSTSEPISMAEAAQTIRLNLEAAVSRRRRGRIGSHFSGGLDSTTIAGLAAQQVEVEKVLAFAKVYPSLPHLSCEEGFINLAAARMPNIKLHTHEEIAASRYTDLQQLPLYDEPHPGIVHAGPAQRFIRSIASKKVDTLFSGVGGDHLFDASLSHYLCQYIRQGKFSDALKHAEMAAKQLSHSRWSILRSSLPRLLPSRFQDGVLAALKNGRAKWESLNDQTVAPWIRQEFAKSNSMFDRGQSWIPSRLATHSNAVDAWSLGLIRLQSGDIERWYSAQPLSIRKSNPFFDRELVESVFSLPNELRYQPGLQKPLLCRAIADILPEEIINRRVKGHFGELADSSLSRSYDELASLVLRSEIPDSIIDKGELLRCLKLASCGAYPGVAALDRLNLTISLLHWLESLDAWSREPFHCELIHGSETHAKDLPQVGAA